MHPQNVTIPAPFRAQSCTHKCAIRLSLHLLYRVLVFTRTSVHSSECKLAPVICAPLRCRFAPFRVQKFFYDCRHDNMGFNVHPYISKGVRLLPKGAYIVTM